MSMITFRPDAARAMVDVAAQYGNALGYLASEMGVALLTAGLTILSSGMDDEQVEALIKQAFDMTAPLRRQTEERWRRTGFDRGTPS
jgi:hypothetical protein